VAHIPTLLQVKDVEQQLPEKVTITIKCPMSAYQSAVYNWIKTTNTIRVDPRHRRAAHGQRAWEPLQNKVMELRKVRCACNVARCAVFKPACSCRQPLLFGGCLRQHTLLLGHLYPITLVVCLSALDEVVISRLLVKRLQRRLTHLLLLCLPPLHHLCLPLQVCNHPRLCYPDTEHFWGNDVVRTCGKMFWLDRMLVKLHASGHRVLLFSTMTKMLDTVEFYLNWREVGM
jgi:SNF2 family DNA or RNA helicase